MSTQAEGSSEMQMLLLNMIMKERIFRGVSFEDPHLMSRHIKEIYYCGSLGEEWSCRKVRRYS